MNKLSILKTISSVKKVFSTSKECSIEDLTNACLFAKRLAILSLLIPLIQLLRLLKLL